MDHYVAVALQTVCRAVNAYTPEEAREAMQQTIAHVAEQVRATRQFVGPDVALVVLPEYFLTSYPRGESISHWKELAAIDIDGAEYEALGELAQSNQIHLAGNVYERDPHFPDLYFQCCFLIDASGSVVLRYRRLVSMFAPTPHDVWDAYLDRYGLDGVFPVANTELGRIGAVASEEILYPEISRMLALRGAEVLVHPTSESGSPDLTPKDIAKRARALENLVYVVSANSAGIVGSGIPTHSTDGMSKVIDYRGAVLARAGTGETMTANAELDLPALRRYRHRPGMPNLLSRQRMELFADGYANTVIHSANGLKEGDSYRVPDRQFFLDQQADALNRLKEEGII